MRDKQEAEPVLTRDAQVGHTVFGKGVKWSTVIEAAYRWHDYNRARDNTAQVGVDAVMKG